MPERKRSLQPFLIVVGDVVTDITEAYVCVDKIFYQFQMTWEAFQTLFEIFYVFDTFYPPESSHLWGIIQQGLFEIKPVDGERVVTHN